MKTVTKYLTLILFLSVSFFPVNNLYAGLSGDVAFTFSETDNPPHNNGDFFGSIFYVFDLRDRETFIQLTNPDVLQTGAPALAHIQIFDVNNNCNENNFFDNYTANDTHTYNMRDIQTNDGNPSGVVLPEGSYGIVAVSMFYPTQGGSFDPAAPIGNLRILDNNGYEYRTNAQSAFDTVNGSFLQGPQFLYSFNYNQENGVSLSDIFGITLFIVESDSVPFGLEWLALPVQGIFTPVDVDIYNLNEVPFSCRDVIFSCVDDDNPLLEEVLNIAGTASVASFEYGINDAIPHSNGGELLCPGNNIGDGMVVLRPEPYPDTQAFQDVISPIYQGDGVFFFLFVGLNNGNQRGAMDSLWVWNDFLIDPP